MLPSNQELSPADLPGLFTNARWQVAQRIETRRVYRSDTTDPRWAPIMRGERIAYDPGRPWYAMVSGLVAAGRQIQRVRIVDDPATQGQHYLLVSGAHNVRAGEQIRTLPRACATTLGLADDVWLFTGGGEDVAATLRFDERDDLASVVLSRDPLRVRTVLCWWSAAWSTASDPYGPRGFTGGPLA